MKIFCQNTKSGLQPLYEDDYDEKKKLKIGEIYFCEIKRPRNIKFHKKFMALIKIGWENTKAFEEEVPFDIYRKWATIKSGFYDAYHTKKGIMIEAKSISFANMNEDTFGQLYEKMLDIIHKDIGTDKKDIEAELINFI